MGQRLGYGARSFFCTCFPIAGPLGALMRTQCWATLESKPGPRRDAAQSPSALSKRLCAMEALVRNTSKCFPNQKVVGPFAELSRLQWWGFACQQLPGWSRASTHLGFTAGRFDRSTVSTNPNANAWECRETPPYSYS